jgi:hypothetical protein
MGVRTDFRPYSADVVAAVLQGDGPLGFITRQESMSWQPPNGFSMGSGKLPEPGLNFTPVAFDASELFT